MSALAGGLGIGAGVGVSSVALAPFNAANTFMGSAFFGYGMILGERYMYQADWPKIQQRLENGEQIENIIQEYTGLFTAVVMKEAKIIFDTVTQEFISIMAEALRSSGIGGTEKTGETQARRGRTNTPPSEPRGSATFSTPTSILKQQPSTLDRQQFTNLKIDKIITTAPKVKRKAGQSQILQRNSLIKQIARFAKDISYLKSLNKPELASDIIKAQRDIQALQIKLSTLLVTYTF